MLLAGIAANWTRIPATTRSKPHNGTDSTHLDWCIIALLKNISSWERETVMHCMCMAVITEQTTSIRTFEDLQQRQMTACSHQ